MNDQDMQARLQAALDTCARMQDQRDQLAAQLKDATRQCGEQTSLLREAQRYVQYHLEHTECDARIVMGLISDIDDALAGKLPERTIPDELPDLVLERTAEAMGEAYDCDRSWSAWSYGTMGPNNFRLVSEDCERVSEVARAAITAWEESAKQAGGA